MSQGAKRSDMDRLLRVEEEGIKKRVRVDEPESDDEHAIMTKKDLKHVLWQIESCRYGIKLAGTNIRRAQKRFDDSCGMDLKQLATIHNLEVQQKGAKENLHKLYRRLGRVQIPRHMIEGDHTAFEAGLAMVHRGLDIMRDAEAGLYCAASSSASESAPCTSQNDSK